MRPPLEMRPHSTDARCTVGSCPSHSCGGITTSESEPQAKLRHRPPPACFLALATAGCLSPGSRARRLPREKRDGVPFLSVKTRCTRCCAC
eukprot:scaffold57211_cov60-Phaeocystis_antarctica.AAC.3